MAVNHLSITGYEAGNTLCGLTLGDRIGRGDTGAHYTYASDFVIRNGAHGNPTCIDCAHEVALSLEEDPLYMATDLT